MSDDSSKKEEEFFGFPVSKLGGPALVVGGLALLGTIAMYFKPQIDQMQNDMRSRQAYAQQQQLLAAQAQQQQIAAQQAALQGGQYPPGSEQQQMPPEQQQTQVEGPPVAIEQDPTSRQPRRVRIPEIEANGTGSDRFNNISI